ncbi:hypothetical protein ASZ90_013776 [hydrocarbon metagenome]|uniref:Lipoprotein n=1 Tax=hydrocarbon metagenome TaxID=938273 RepID=A0A0W8F6R4_9ZZZZ
MLFRSCGPLLFFLFFAIITTACLYVKIYIDFGLKMPDPASLFY